VAQFGLLDAYSRRARLFPVMLVLMPLVIAAAAWPATLTLVPVAVALFAWFGLGVLFAEIGRDLGKRREAELWESWGGSPTVQRLRVGGPQRNAAVTDRWRQLIARIAPDISLPTAESEAAEPRNADNVYDVCVGRLRELTRDTSKFPIVFQENISYGFRRNLWAMKAAAIVIIAIALLVALSAILVHGISAVVVSSLVVSSVMLTWWVVRITPAWVRQAAESYADRLLWSCEQLTSPNGGGAR
jgi:hypothetical protein